MRYSKMFIPTLKENPRDAQIVSHRLMLRSGMIRQVAAGIYNYLPLGWRVIQKISQIVREELNSCGAQEIQMPMVQPAELWKDSGRWEKYGAELLRFKDRKDTDYCLGPTHEEIITDLIRNNITSYRQLPINLYQIQTKFRDEIRPRFGLMRGREFLMKDAYSFSIDKESALLSYADMQAAYHRIFKRCGLKFVMVEADTGTIGGDTSHEFQVLADTGEDEIAVCESCNVGRNVELNTGKECAKCGTPYTFKRGIEVGHVFHLGTKYSRELNAEVLDEAGQKRFIDMGCYGIGIGRTAAAAIEQNHDEAGIIWPMAIAPFEVACVQIGDSPAVSSLCEELYKELQDHNIDVLYDDRNERPGIKFKDQDLLGCPIRVMVGARSAELGLVEIKSRVDLKAEAKSMSVQEAIIYIKNEVTRSKA